MTLLELSEEVNTIFFRYYPSDQILKRAAKYATDIANKHWPEIKEIEVSVSPDYYLTFVLHPVFNNSEDYVWWTLKYG